MCLRALRVKIVGYDRARLVFNPQLKVARCSRTYPGRVPVRLQRISLMKGNGRSSGQADSDLGPVRLPEAKGTGFESASHSSTDLS